MNDNSNVINFPGLTRLDLDSEAMLKEIAKQKPHRVFCIVWPEEGNMPTYHSNTSDVPLICFRLQEFIHKTFNGDFY